ncbi:MAG: hypothetical protein CVU28_13910 [Betaproteobacteria bacterium HGW-Betaproteobacteria-21]|nr:MAG: hypothetical protein CVU28_13910 [Betaproteobacteria bacterium HGW-Betaproteobacteria-21]
MHTDTHGNPTRATILWLLLIVATVLTWAVGERGSSGVLIVAFLAVLSIAKGSVIILDFMALRRAPLMWRVLTLGWMALVWALIGLAYWNGMPT